MSDWNEICTNQSHEGFTQLKIDCKRCVEEKINPPMQLGVGGMNDFVTGYELRKQLGEVEKQKNAAYSERNSLVCFMSKIFKASLELHPDVDMEWENDWRWIVFIDLPTGQATWRIHDSELSSFDHLPRNAGRVWDGHTTEEKYVRIAKYCRGRIYAGEIQ
jgi:hypothetical protein